MGKIIPIKIREKLVSELYNAGMNPLQISETLDMTIKEVKDILGPNTSFVNNKSKVINQDLINQIMYDNNIPVSLDVIINNEKSRYRQYAEIESKSLAIMNRFLNYYSTREPTGDASEDRLVINMVSLCIKATQDVRQELLKKYEIDMKLSEKDDTIKVEFI